MGLCRTCLIYLIDKHLHIITRQVFGHLSLIVVREDHCDQRNALIHDKGGADQPFPAWIFATHEKQLSRRECDHQDEWEVYRARRSCETPETSGRD